MITAQSNFRDILKAKKDLVLKATQKGVVMGLPAPDEVGKTWNKDQATTPFCSIGDPRSLRVLVPVPAVDYDILRQDIRNLGGDAARMPVTIRIQGRGDHLWKGRITLLPQSNATTIPPALSSREAAPWPSNRARRSWSRSPRSTSSASISKTPTGRYVRAPWPRSRFTALTARARWWLWRTISSTFDLGLM